MNQEELRAFVHLDELQMQAGIERYGIIAPLLDDGLSKAARREIVEHLCSKHEVTPRTLRRYLAHYRKARLAGLVRKKRKDTGSLRKISPHLIAVAVKLHAENRDLGMDELFKLVQHSPDLSKEDKAVAYRTFCRHLAAAGYARLPASVDSERPYHKFCAEHANDLWQGDARVGIWLPHPTRKGKWKKAKLFAFLDDFSRYCVAARYFWNEKLPAMEETFKNAVLRFGLALRLYVDHGSVFISRHFAALLVHLGVRKVKSGPYRAWVRGKIEKWNRTVKEKFQSLAKKAGIQTLEELNAKFAAWLETEYHHKIHSETGETPARRFHESLRQHPPRRIRDLETFELLFMWRREPRVDRYGRIRMHNNYYTADAKPGETLQAYYSPFDLAVVHLFRGTDYLGLAKPFRLAHTTATDIPRETEKPKHRVSREARLYFQELLEKYNDMRRREAGAYFRNLLDKENKGDRP